MATRKGQSYAERREYLTKYREAHKAELNEKQRKYRKEHPDRVAEAQKRYRAKRKEAEMIATEAQMHII